MTTNNLRLEQRREQIIQAALGCFIEQGFHQTGMRDIAAAAGVSLGNLYNHFARKEELIALIASLEAPSCNPCWMSWSGAGPGGAGPLRRRLPRLVADPGEPAARHRDPGRADPPPRDGRHLRQQPAPAVRCPGGDGAPWPAGGELAAHLQPDLTAQLLLDALEGQAVRHALALHPEQAPVEQRLPSLLDQLLGPAC